MFSNETIVVRRARAMKNHVFVHSNFVVLIGGACGISRLATFGLSGTDLTQKNSSKQYAKKFNACIVECSIVDRTIQTTSNLVIVRPSNDFVSVLNCKLKKRYESLHEICFPPRRNPESRYQQPRAFFQVLSHS